MGSRNKLVVPGAVEAINQMKYEMAREFSIAKGAETRARQNKVGKDMTKRLLTSARKKG